MSSVKGYNQVETTWHRKSFPLTLLMCEEHWKMLCRWRLYYISMNIKLDLIDSNNIINQFYYLEQSEHFLHNHVIFTNYARNICNISLSRNHSIWVDYNHISLIHFTLYCQCARVQLHLSWVLTICACSSSKWILWLMVTTLQCFLTFWYGCSDIMHIFSHPFTQKTCSVRTSQFCTLYQCIQDFPGNT